MQVKRSCKVIFTEHEANILKGLVNKALKKNEYPQWEEELKSMHKVMIDKL